MNTPTELQPVVSIDLKRNRIRIHKSTLHMIGDPTFINILVNPINKIIAIKSSSYNDCLALRIRENQLSDGNCVEFGCRELISLLNNMGDKWHINSSYRIYGKCNKKEAIAEFPLKDSIQTKELKSYE